MIYKIFSLDLYFSDGCENRSISASSTKYESFIRDEQVNCFLSTELLPTNGSTDFQQRIDGFDLFLFYNLNHSSTTKCTLVVGLIYVYENADSATLSALHQ